MLKYLYINTTKYPEYVPDHFQNPINSSVVHNLHIFPKFHENPPISFKVILQTNRPKDGGENDTLVKSGRGNDVEQSS